MNGQRSSEPCVLTVSHSIERGGGGNQRLDEETRLIIEQIKSNQMSSVTYLGLAQGEKTRGGL